MRPITELYPDLLDDGYFYAGSYQPILDDIGHIAFQRDDSDYQGSSYILYHEGTSWGYLTFGWGSCSGCDWLQACSTPDEVDELRQNLRGNVRWEESAADMLKYLVTNDWDGRWESYYSEHASFLRDAIKLLADAAYDESRD